MRLSKLSSQEMIVEAFEKASKQILKQTALIKELTIRCRGTWRKGRRKRWRNKFYT